MIDESSIEKAVEVGQRFQRILNALNLYHKDIAQTLKYSRPAVSRWIQGITIVPEYVAFSLDILYGVNSEWLFTGKGKMFHHNLPERTLEKIQKYSQRYPNAVAQYQAGEIINQAKEPDKLFFVIKTLVNNSDLLNLYYYQIITKSV